MITKAGRLWKKAFKAARIRDELRCNGRRKLAKVAQHLKHKFMLKAMKADPYSFQIWLDRKDNDLVCIRYEDIVMHLPGKLLANVFSVPFSEIAPRLYKPKGNPHDHPC